MKHVEASFRANSASFEARVLKHSEASFRVLHASYEVLTFELPTRFPEIRVRGFDQNASHLGTSHVKQLYQNPSTL